MTFFYMESYYLSLIIDILFRTYSASKGMISMNIINQHSSSPPPKTENSLYCPGPKLVGALGNFSFSCFPNVPQWVLLILESDFLSGLSFLSQIYMCLDQESYCHSRQGEIFSDTMF